MLNINTIKTLLESRYLKSHKIKSVHAFKVFVKVARKLLHMDRQLDYWIVVSSGMQSVRSLLSSIPNNHRWKFKTKAHRFTFYFARRSALLE